jgi:hypothetical protein
MRENENAAMSMRVSDIESKLADAIKTMVKLGEELERLAAVIAEARQ